jgi:3-oxoacyl-(acyl-carrier-protein) synthase
LSRIFVTGLGVTSAIGEDLAANHEALKNGICGISTLDLFPSRYEGSLPCGEIKTSTQTLKERLKAHEPMATRTMLLGLHAFQEAVHDAGLDATKLGSSDTALIGASTVGGMCLTDELYKDANAETGGSPYLSAYDYASVVLYLQERYQMKGIVNTINTACSSSANAIMYGARLIQNGLANRAIVGGVDSLAKFTINGFNALRILSPEACRPFDCDRQGLNLGEGAAFLVLEKEFDISNKKVYAEFKGWGNANDAFHPSSLSEQGEGPYLSMAKALANAGLQVADIGFINAHGTATENNDEVESRAMLRLFEKAPPFASTKSNTGHTLGAAGALEAVFSILNLFHQEVYPGLHFKNSIPGLGLEPIPVYSKLKLDHVMSNSFGFGGNCTSLIFSKA